jgi:hypothetical protein
VRFETFEEAHPGGFAYAQLREHPAIVVLPYTKVSSFFCLFFLLFVLSFVCSLVSTARAAPCSYTARTSMRGTATARRRCTTYLRVLSRRQLAVY